MRDLAALELRIATVLLEHSTQELASELRQHPLAKDASIEALVKRIEALEAKVR